MTATKTVLILGANSDVAKATIPLYLRKGYDVVAASRSTTPILDFLSAHDVSRVRVKVLYFDATAFATHRQFYDSLNVKPNIVVYAAGFLKDNEEALRDWDGAHQMMNVHYCGAVSILNIIAMDTSN